MENLSDIVTDYYASLRHAMMQGPPPELSRVVDVLYSAYLRRAHVYTFGNGACAALAAHMACDLGRTVTVRSAQGGTTNESRLRVASLADNSPLVTANANDSSYEDVFVEQLKCLIDPGDAVIAISTGGTSPNVVRAAEYARKCGATTIGFTGSADSAMALVSHCDIAVRSPAVKMEQIEDMHVTFHHIVTLMLRQRIGEYLAGLVAHQANGHAVPNNRHPVLVIPEDGILARTEAKSDSSPA